MLNLHIDRLSFWLGFIAACILWWLASRIRPLIPHWQAQVQDYIDKIRQENLAGVEGILRTETIRRAQRQHLAAALFPLDEVLIQPHLLAPPTGHDPANLQTTQSIASQVIPSLPDWPEILAPFGVPVFTPLDALQYGRNIAIIGQPGSGKSTALGYLASQIARQEDGKAPGSVPLYIHVLDLNLNLDLDEDPLAYILKELSTRAGVLHTVQLKQFLQAVLRDKQRRVVFLLDGLDELPPDQLTTCVKFLQALHDRYPRLQTILTASADYLDGLTELGFYPLGIAAWTTLERVKFAEKWGELWDTLVVPELKKQPGFHEIDPVLFESWLSDETDYLSPLEWTLRIWGAYVGDLSGCSPVNILDTHIGRFLPDPAFLTVLEEVAHTFIQSGAADLPFSEIDKIISRYKPPKSTPSVPTEESTAGSTTPFNQSKKSPTKIHRDLSISLGEQVVTGLIEGGIMIEHTNNRVSFSNPVFMGFLAGMKTSEEEAITLLSKLKWTALVETLHYASAFHENGDWVLKLIEDPEPPLYHDLLTTCRWLRDAPPNASWRSQLMRTLVNLLQNESIPLSTRLRFIGAFYLSRDPSSTRLFKQLLSSQSPNLRRAALLGCGIMGKSQQINDVLGLLSDPVSDVRFTACLALSIFPTEAALNAIVEILLSGDEELRQAAAESLALNEKEGKKLLEEAAFIDDLLVRRAAVFGILQIQQPWAKQTLEKMAVEDSQWVVRNAAAQALETIQHMHPTIPRPLPPVSEAPWLLTFASKLGLGILPGQDGVDVLLKALNTGTEEEQVAALTYLRNYPSEGVINAIYQLLFSKRTDLHEAALYALWWINLSGFELPKPTQFGLG